MILKKIRVYATAITTFIFIAVILDNFISGAFNMPLLILLSLAMVTLPLIEFIISKKYQYNGKNS